MLDFLKISKREGKKKGAIEVYPKFIIRNPSSDLMIRGGDFYAIWLEDKGLWSTNEQDAIDEIDRYLDEYIKENDLEGAHCYYMWDSESGIIDKWHKYCQKQMRDSYKMLDESLIFSNDPTNKRNYASKSLNYPLEAGPAPAWDKLVGTLYEPEERHKIEWAIGSIVSGESKRLQKFVVLYGAAGTGKSTILNIMEELFDGYWAAFDAKALGSNNNAFALEAFKNNPLVAIQHDGDLSRIEDNSVLNSLVSHEKMMVNEKYKSTYATRFNAFLFMGTNKPVKITDAKSGLLRRLIDVHPSGNKLKKREYNETMKQIKFELGQIANRCKEVYLEDPNYYDDYVPINMMGASNDFYNYVIDSYHIFKEQDGTTLKAAWELYKVYCDDANVPYKLSRMRFKEELKNYFYDFQDQFDMGDGFRVRSYYSGFRLDKFENSEPPPKVESIDISSWIKLEKIESIFDQEYADSPAQYATANETPAKPWDKVKSTLASIDTSRLHYVKPPYNVIVIDFDLKNDIGQKDLRKNIEAASSWPKTYAEVSKSGQALHLVYKYTGDVNELSRIYADDIEIKVFKGKSSLRRKLSLCNDLPIASISSGLPLKEKTNVINKDILVTEKGLRTTVKKCLNKEVHADTRSNMDFIYKVLKDAYDSGVSYDIRDMQNAVIAFAAQSTNQSEYCLKLASKIPFCSEDNDPPERIDDIPDDSLIFFDCEVFPNLFVVCWKMAGENSPVVRMINPTPAAVEDLVSRHHLVGFNCRLYDNHILYARMLGYSNERLYDISQKIINSPKGSMGPFFREAYNLSYTDIYDFASAGNKMSLKKLEIEMGIHHQELGLPWDQPVDESKWVEVADYCCNDVIATEAAFNYLSADWEGRKILSELSNLTPNDKTNSHTERMIFGTNKKPQNEFTYRDLSEPVFVSDFFFKPGIIEFLEEACPEMMAQPFHATHDLDPDVPFEVDSVLPYFPGYEYKNGKSTYRGEEVGEGGYVYAEPGIYRNVALLDISSMHPHSIIAECLFGPRYTKVFRDLVEGRVAIKHEDWDAVNDILDGKLTPYVQKIINGEMKSKDLADALKTAINSVYGLTVTSYNNPFNDPSNKDNIVAKRGALFMVDLKHAVQEKGFTVAHIKTDSIKIPDATPEIIQFVIDFGKRYGYSFEHEATYDRMCLVNDAVYIAKYDNGEWTATGKQFAVPYVFKKLFSKEPIKFEDMCETFSVSTSLYLDFNETLADVSEYELLQEARSKNSAGKKLTKKELTLIEDNIDISDEKLKELIAEGHDYHFVGRVGSFTPILPGHGGGELLRKGTNGYSSATGAKGYRWLESEVANDLEAIIDKSFYNNLVDKAIEAISQFGDFEGFIA